jgi:Na+/pantothenate symporter
MSVLPVSISIMASFLPSTSFIGFPAVVYGIGTQFWVNIFAAMLAGVIACEGFIRLII